MSRADSEFLAVEREQDVWTIRFRPADLMMFARPEIAETLFGVLTEIRGRSVKVLRGDYPAGCLAPDVVDRFWAEVRNAPVVPGGRREAPLPALVRNASNTILRLLERLRRMTTLSIASFQGEVDFDLFGVLLVGHFRICSEDTVIVNHVLDRESGPGSAVFWLLTRFLGLATANHLLMEGRSLTAREALDLRLVNRVVPAADLEGEAEAIAQQFAARPARVLASLVRAASNVDADLPTYLERTGSGFGE